MPKIHFFLRYHYEQENKVLFSSTTIVGTINLIQASWVVSFTNCHSLGK